MYGFMEACLKYEKHALSFVFEFNLRKITELWAWSFTHALSILIYLLLNSHIEKLQLKAVMSKCNVHKPFAIPANIFKILTMALVMSLLKLECSCLESEGLHFFLLIQDKDLGLLV